MEERGAVLFRAPTLPGAHPMLLLADSCSFCSGMLVLMPRPCLLCPSLLATSSSTAQPVAYGVLLLLRHAFARATFTPVTVSATATSAVVFTTTSLAAAGQRHGRSDDCARRAVLLGMRPPHLVLSRDPPAVRVYLRARATARVASTPRAPRPAAPPRTAHFSSAQAAPAEGGGRAPPRAASASRHARASPLSALACKSCRWSATSRTIECSRSQLCISRWSAPRVRASRSGLHGLGRYAVV